MANKYTESELREAVENSDNKSEVISYLGMSKSGASYRYLEKKIKSLDIDTSHWYSKDHKRVPAKLDDILVENSTYRSSNSLKVKLIKHGMFALHCSNEDCGISEWMGKPITLQLDHINGVNNDNRIENLRLLCPNCHSQTETWGNKKRS